MSKKKDKAKKTNPKKERYAKFRKDKAVSMDVSMPDLSDDQMKQKRDDESKIGQFLRYRPKYPERFVNERKAKSKR